MEDDGGGYFVDEGFVLSGLFADAALDHGSVSEHAGESFVEEFDGDLWQELAQAVDEGLYAHHVLAVLSVHLAWLSDNDALYGLTRHIVENVALKLGGLHGAESVGDELQGVGHGQPCSFFTVVDGEEAHNEREKLKMHNSKFKIQNSK